MSEKIISEADAKRVDEAREKLMEHFDSVRIFVTLSNSEHQETGAYTTGGGNFYAQVGQIQEWLIRRNQDVINEVNGGDDEE